jgi:predicted nucleic acid-binding protein
MKVIVDTNVIFSAILSPTGKFGQILFFGNKIIDFYAPNLVKIELERHKDKLINLSDYTTDDFEKTRDDIFSCLTFISEEEIPYTFWHKALPIVRETDTDDIAFVVLTEYIDAQLWTGDRKLLKGLRKMGFTKGITTEEIYDFVMDPD